MKQQSLWWVALLGVAGCATPRVPMPPAPVTAPSDAAMTGDAAPDTATAVAAADATALNDLADAAPEGQNVPAFDADDIRWDIDVRTYATHPRVRYYLDYFQGPARARMAIFLDRGAAYDAMIRRRFEREGLPGDLGYLALIESGYSNDAVSRSNAVGMWQFMKATGSGYGLRVDTWVDERRDPVKALDAAARHLRDLRARFGSLYLAAAAYNAGAGKVSRSLGKLEWEQPLAQAIVDSAAAADTTDELAVEAGEAGEAEAELAVETVDITSDAAFFRLASTDLLAAETQDYVPKLIAAALIAKQPDRYGFEPTQAEPFSYDSIIVPDVTGLDVIARLAGAPVAMIKQLNPQYLRLATPPRTRAVVRLPAGTGSRVADGYAKLPSSRRVQFMTHVVRRGERWSTVAKRYHLLVSDLRAANPKKRSTLKAGTRLVIPAVVTPSALAMRATGMRSSVRDAKPVRTARLATRSTPQKATHRVRRGETLTGVARRYQVSIRALARANALPSDYELRTGMRLRIPT